MNLQEMMSSIDKIQELAKKGEIDEAMEKLKIIPRGVSLKTKRKSPVPRNRDGAFLFPKKYMSSE